ncbi:hypothetical protein KCP71_03700 [Salmonella enterica subsp. enterica]|nr:hypothetical protein KCP71_03700 [Salmonella enterica subsp. enterica]
MAELAYYREHFIAVRCNMPDGNARASHPADISPPLNNYRVNHFSALRIIPRCFHLSSAALPLW